MEVERSLLVANDFIRPNVISDFITILHISFQRLCIRKQLQKEINTKACRHM